MGHMELVGQVLQECDEVMIAVTSSQYNYLPMDPFTAGERIEMIRAAMIEAGVQPDRYMILGLENRPNVATWMAYLRAALPKFERVYSGNPYVAMLLADSNMQVVHPKMVNRSTYNATDIRRAMINGGDWQERVPPAVAHIIESINGAARVKTIMESDTNPTTH